MEYFSKILNLFRRRAPESTVAEIIGHNRFSVITNAFARFNRGPTLDWNRSDYRFWDRLRHAKEPGYELSALFLKPLHSKKAGWVLGQAPTWKFESDKLGELVGKWWTANQAEIVRASEESAALGDCYLAINPDRSLLLIQPDVVYPIVDEDNYGRIVGWELIQEIPHPVRAGDKMQIVDQFFADRRVRIVRRNGLQIRPPEEYPNLLNNVRPGLLPIVHVPNNVGINERFGRPEAESLLPLLHRYSEVFQAAIEGNMRQGRPTPTISNMGTPQDVQTFWDLYGSTEQHTLPDGTVESIRAIEFDGDKLLTLSGGATFGYMGPGSFTGDTRVLLELMFYLFLQHTEIPEFAWGNAIASSMASASTQLDPFIKWITKERGRATHWLNELARVIAAYESLLNPGVQYSEPQIAWSPLTEKDGALTLSALQWAKSEGLIDEATALRLAPVDVPDVKVTLDAAHKERDEAQAKAAEAQKQAAAAAPPAAQTAPAKKEPIPLTKTA